MASCKKGMVVHDRRAFKDKWGQTSLLDLPQLLNRQYLVGKSCILCKFVRIIFIPCFIRLLILKPSSRYGDPGLHLPIGPLGRVDCLIIDHGKETLFHNL